MGLLGVDGVYFLKLTLVTCVLSEFSEVNTNDLCIFLHGFTSIKKLQKVFSRSFSLALHILI